MVTHVLVEQSDGLRVRRVRTWDRLIARIRGPVLDRELAAGVSPESSITLAVHAGQLCERGERKVLARSLARLAATAGAELAPSRGRRLGVPLSRPAIRSSEAELTAVVDRLEANGPVAVQGVARIRSLLSDGSGPLYRHATPSRLRRELRAALEAMDCAA